MCKFGDFGNRYSNGEAPRGESYDSPLVATTVRSGRMGFTPPARAMSACLSNCPKCGHRCISTIHSGGYHDCGDHSWK
jgi:hypothetical protein